MTDDQIGAARAALAQILGREARATDVLLLARSMLPTERMGTFTAHTGHADGRGSLVIGKNVVLPNADIARSDVGCSMIGQAIAWRSAHDILDAVGDAIGSAMFTEFCGGGEPVPDDAGYDVVTVTDRIAAQLRYSDEHFDWLVGEVLPGAVRACASVIPFGDEDGR